MRNVAFHCLQMRKFVREWAFQAGGGGVLEAAALFVISSSRLGDNSIFGQLVITGWSIYQSDNDDDLAYTSQREN